jgi:enamine deaminase RidA (YjgF/YER057c/UK114 family)
VASTEERLKKLGLTLPEPTAPIGAFIPFTCSGDLLFISGQIPILPNGTIITGRVEVDLNVKEAYSAARLCGLWVIGVARIALPSLDNIIRVVRLGGFVNAEPGFAKQPQVIDGASKLMIEVWGEKGKHARTAVGVASLPANAVVEVDAIFEVGS